MAGTHERLRLIFAFRIRCDRRSPGLSRINRGACVRYSCYGDRSDHHPNRVRTRRPGAGRHDSLGAGTCTNFPTLARRTPAMHCHQSLPSVVAWLPHQADARTGGNAMRWIYDACGNADLEEVAFAGMAISAILEHVNISSAPRETMINAARPRRTSRAARRAADPARACI